MNERGIFTMIGICLLLVAAIFITGIQEFEANYSRGVKNFQAEHHLQNLAESYLIEEYENLPDFTGTYKITKLLGTYQKLENVEVVIWAQKQTDIEMNDENKNLLRNNSPGTILISVASCDSPFIVGKIYRRAFAYILDGDSKIYYVNQLPEH